LNERQPYITCGSNFIYYIIVLWNDLHLTIFFIQFCCNMYFAQLKTFYPTFKIKLRSVKSELSRKFSCQHACNNCFSICFRSTS